MKTGPPQSSQSGPLCLSSWECQCQSYGLIPDPSADSERSPASLCLSPVKYKHTIGVRSSTLYWFERFVATFTLLTLLFIQVFHDATRDVGKGVSDLFGGQRPRGFVWLFTEMCVVHVGSHWGDSACAQLVLMLVSKPRVDIFTHKALHWLHHVLEVLGIGRWVALQVYLNLQTTNDTGWVCKCKYRKWHIRSDFFYFYKTDWPWLSQSCLPLLSCPQNQRPQSSSAVSAPPTEWD